MSSKKKCIHVYVKTNGFDKCDLQLIKNKFRKFADELGVTFDCDFLSVSYVSGRDY